MIKQGMWTIKTATVKFWALVVLLGMCLFFLTGCTALVGYKMGEDMQKCAELNKTREVPLTPHECLYIVSPPGCSDRTSDCK